MSEVKPIYIDVEHLENMYLQMLNANGRNMAEKHRLQDENKKLRESLRQIHLKSVTIPDNNTLDEICDLTIEALKEKG